MKAELAKRRFTIQEYERLAETGILSEDDRVELVAGEVAPMTPIGRRHVVAHAAMDSDPNPDERSRSLCTRARASARHGSSIS